ncbi:MAG TPA: hypothetical protein VHX11_07790 [Acidobacteriaceae bacterium]|jgi:hypothetical protein|nr:hypothetical protein [Acidobacteriaceae bacterium]
MTYGTSTRSYNRSPEKRQMDEACKESTDRFLGLCHCGQTAIALCAWKVKPWMRLGQKSETCDRPVCGLHAKFAAPEKALCPEHQKCYDEWKDKRVGQGTLFPEAA